VAKVREVNAFWAIESQRRRQQVSKRPRKRTWVKEKEGEEPKRNSTKRCKRGAHGVPEEIQKRVV